MSWISLTGIGKRYDGVLALKSASLELRAGEVHALMGENGAGKSTLARVLAGAVRPDAGTITIDGVSCDIHSPLDAQRHGIGIIHQELDLFPHLTVGENIVIGNLRFSERVVVNAARIEEFCRPFLAQVGLTCQARDAVSSLSIAQRQLLAIARPLSMNARLLIMDEPTSALSEDAAERLFSLIGTLKRRGVTVVYVSHKMEEIFRLSDRITVLRDGQTISTLEAAATDTDEVIRMMVGRSLTRFERRPRAPRSNVLLSVMGLSTRKLRSVSFELHAGEVLGIAGLVGSGRSSLGAALSGLEHPIQGRLRLQGEPFGPRNVRDALRRGLGLLPEDRKLQGLMMQMSARENSTLSVLPRLASAGVIRRRLENDAVRPLSHRLNLDPAALDRPVSTLSGGNQQKALLMRLLLANPDVLFLDDPARGIDVGAKEDIYSLIDELAAAGKGIVLVSSELPELWRRADRILVLNQGRVGGVFETLEATQELIMAAATAQIANLQTAC